jgi:hypothetical protein
VSISRPATTVNEPAALVTISYAPLVFEFCGTGPLVLCGSNGIEDKFADTHVLVTPSTESAVTATLSATASAPADAI